MRIDFCAVLVCKLSFVSSQIHCNRPLSIPFSFSCLQNKIEHFIHSGLRRPMLMGHRQAWVWQDEWHGLTIEDIRKLEEETQRILATKMGASQDRDSDQEVGFANDKGRGSVVYVQDNNNSTKLELICTGSLDESEGNVSPSPVAITVEKFGYSDEEQSQVMNSKLRRKNIECNGVGQKDMSSTFDSSAGRGLSQADYLRGYRMSTIETVESDSDDEFFDAQGTI